MSSHLLESYTAQWVQYEKQTVHGTMKHLINKNIVSSLTDQALIGKKPYLNPPTVFHWRPVNNHRLLSAVVNRFFRGWN